MPPRPVAKKPANPALANKLAGVKLPQRRTEPLWEGPEKGGITQSLLSRFLACPERFRLLVCEGLAPHDNFNHRIEYGNMWHVCEEALAASAAPWDSDVTQGRWKAALHSYSRELTGRYRSAQHDVVHWYRTCLVHFPEYIRYWMEHPDVIDRTPLFQEESFAVPYTLPSGRIVTLRGKWDSVDLVGGPKGGIYLQENKTKGDINEQQLKRQLNFDLQTMLYLVALETWLKTDPNYNGDPKPIRGVRYNVIRRPFSGGRGSIRQHKPSKSNPRGESTEEFYERFKRDYLEVEPEYWFMRWKVEVKPADVEAFKVQFLHPTLERLVDWWYHVGSHKSPFHNQGGKACPLHYRMPFGLYNVLLEGGSTEYDEYLDTGSEAGLTHIDNLFPEL